MSKRTTLFTITRKQWMDAIAEWLTARREEDKILTWEQVLEKEGGVGETFFNSISDAQSSPSSYPGQWFLSGQTDFSVYNESQYVYSLLFGMLVVSGSVMATIGKRESEEPNITDVGGSIFTAYRLLQRGVKHVAITNFEAPQAEFAEFAAAKFHLPVAVQGAAAMIAPHSVIVCSEYLEHFRNVDEELARITAFKPQRIYESSSFCMCAYGHFIPITVGGKEHTTSRTARRALYEEMARLGYSREDVPCFNRGFVCFNRIGE